MTKQVLFISKSGKPLETRLHIIRALNPRRGENFILNFIPRVSSLYDAFDDNEGLFHSHYYWKSERPGEIKLPDRQFLIPSENKKHGIVKG